MKAKRIMRVVALVAAVSVVALVGGAVAVGAREVLTTQGSTTVLPIAQAAAEEYMDLAEMGVISGQPDITVRGGGSGTGIAALIDGTVDIANASRPIKEKEIASAKDKGVQPYEVIVAKDGMAVIVHPSNSLNGLTIDEIKGIFTGDMSSWSDVGGSSDEIVVISRDSASGTFEAFKELALEGADVRADALRLGSNRAVATTVSKTPGAIGYVGIGYLSDAVKGLAVNGVVPANETVVSGEYMLARPLFMYTDGEPEGLAEKFLDFVLSLAGQRIVGDVGFVPVR